MTTINKNPLSPASLAIADLLNNNWSVANAEYNIPSYTEITDTIRALFANEQGNLCCYCMRKISTLENSVTLEHIIPQSADTTEAAKYQTAAAPLKNWVIHKILFDRNSRIDIPPAAPFSSAKPQPHNIAYYNLIASCNEDKTCNKKRGTNYIAPFLHDSAKVALLKYTVNGVLSGYQAPTGETLPDFEGIANLGLHNPNIWNFIREIWYHLSRNTKFTQATDVQAADIETQIQLIAAAKKIKIATHLRSTFASDSQFSAKIPLYSYFFYYYRQLYPL